MENMYINKETFEWLRRRHWFALSGINSEDYLVESMKVADDFSNRNLSYEITQKKLLGNLDKIITRLEPWKNKLWEEEKEDKFLFIRVQNAYDDFLNVYWNIRTEINPIDETKSGKPPKFQLTVLQ